MFKIISTCVVIVIVIVVTIATGVTCRRHHHHNHHLENRSSRHTSDQINVSSQVRADEDSNPGFTHYNKHNAGRHVCSTHKTVTLPVKTVQTFCKPTYKKYMQRCNDDQLCTGVKLVFETAYRDVYSTKNTRQLDFSCCPGWTQIIKTSHGCNKPVCSAPCQNGGTCTRPDTCSCPKGYKGRHCETDIDECKELKPCDQICRNVPGSYKCDCREMFILQPDGQSCKMEEEDEGTGIEARDLEYELLDKRLFKIETLLNDSPNVISKTAITDINEKVESLTSDLKTLKNNLHDFEVSYRDLRVMKTKVHALESKIGKIEELSKNVENFKRNAHSNKIYP